MTADLPAQGVGWTLITSLAVALEVGIFPQLGLFVEAARLTHVWLGQHARHPDERVGSASKRSEQKNEDDVLCCTPPPSTFTATSTLSRIPLSRFLLIFPGVMSPASRSRRGRHGDTHTGKQTMPGLTGEAFIGTGGASRTRLL